MHAHPREQERAGSQHQRPDEGVRPVAAGPRDDLARDDARRHRAEHERGQNDTGRGRGGADHALDEKRYKADRPEHRRSDEAHADDARGDGPVPQHVEGQDRLAHAPFGEAKRREQHDRGNERSDDVARAPRIVPPTPDEPKEERRRSEPEQRGTKPVDRMLLLLPPPRHRHEDHGERNDADGQVDVEDPPPRHVGDEPATQDRTERGREHRRHDEHG